MADGNDAGDVVLESFCWICLYFWGRNDATGKFECRAFPDGIPDVYIEGQEHDKIVKGQEPERGQVVFTPR